MTYDKSGNVKHVFCVDGCKMGLQLLNRSELFETISKECRSINGTPAGTLCAGYSPLSTVKEHYTPELMFK